MNKLLVSSLACALAACNGGTNGSDEVDGGGVQPDARAPIEFDERGLLENVATNVILPLYEQFEREAGELATAIGAYCDALEAGDGDSARATARDAFHEAMDVWQRAELMVVGPASRDRQAFRDNIYSWPTVSACIADRAVMRYREDPSAFTISEELPNRRGLDVLDYLLFEDGLESACAAAPEGWSALSNDERLAARCAYADVVAADIEAVAGALVDAWHPEAGDFAGDLASAGESGSSFETRRDALDAVFAALFHLDTGTKDGKLGAPLGLVDNQCGAEGACPDELEARYAARGARNIEANVSGFEQLFFGLGADGEDRLGFDDYLAAAGEEALAADVSGGIGGIRDALAALPAELREALTDSYEAVAEVHDRMRDVTTPLKTTVPETLGLEIPTEAGGDTD